ncbi:MAG: RNA-binding protein [Desmonostoc geniculatum HA4340-LM1]|jgi:RNA recognition motif-containing protein|uniref:RNA-binding protein n=1 Tax=Desmonostoc muscorum LEGE 12446 TaxID=1828758 RepID=A0A8J7DDW1_DESMC|nr:RNA-binding protein [Desmonostoc muscorum]MBD2410743.1 RNA-binding protein [Nostoc calcicola FACHB-3891]MBD2513677.1 RNA-binding protein [Nostoc sp. FACHB-973]MBW4675443.1 RNA-binding protein [Desmonostoc geniculatum HA4340-LM1]MBX9255142.1 RNA-binding protein [Desmonostoc muscorum CCALA 125]MDZ8058748.1 RNA-binding protein [Nostoc sp. EkiNYC01]OKH17391.1 RNA-binding protein [Nostoc calcicola FACHB-389]
MSIYVGNLSYQVTEDDLRRAFAEYGTVARVQLPTDRETGKPRGFAFVEMQTDAEEQAAIDALDGAEWMGRDLRVNKAKPREERSNSPRGSWGGGNARRNRNY